MNQSNTQLPNDLAAQLMLRTSSIKVATKETKK